MLFLRYSLDFANYSSEILKYFDIDSENGELYFIGEVKINESVNYEIRIIAQDEGFPPLKSFAFVKVEISNNFMVISILL